MAVEEGLWDRTSDPNSQKASHRSGNRVGLEDPCPILQDFGKPFSKNEDL